MSCQHLVRARELLLHAVQDPHLCCFVVQTCPICQKGTSTNYDLAWVSQIFLIKTNFIPAFPYCPTYRCTPAGVHLVPARQPSGYPAFILLYVSGYVVSPKAVAYSPPCKTCHGTLKGQMFYCFMIHAEVTVWIPNPMPTN